MFPHVLKHFMLDLSSHHRLEAFQTPAFILRSRAQPVRRGGWQAMQAMDALGNVTQQKDAGGNPLESMIILSRIYDRTYMY